MDNKKMEPALQNEQVISAEVLRRLKELPKTTNSNLHIKMTQESMSIAIEILLRRVVDALGLADYSGKSEAIKQVCEVFSNPGPTVGIALIGKARSGKTALLRAMKNFIEVVGDIPEAWTYVPEVQNLDCRYVWATEFRNPITYYEDFKLALSSPILIIDGLGMETEFREAKMTRELMNLMIQLRSDYGLLTIIGSRFDLESLTEIYGEEVGLKLKHSYRFIDIDGSNNID